MEIKLDLQNIDKIDNSINAAKSLMCHKSISPFEMTFLIDIRYILEQIKSAAQEIKERGQPGGMRDKPAPSLTTTRSPEIECSGAPADRSRPAPQHSQSKICPACGYAYPRRFRDGSWGCDECNHQW
jgi:hypothetical protein